MIIEIENRERTPGKAFLAERIERDFTYHAPRPDQIPRYNELRDQAKLLALRMIDLCPESRELSLAREGAKTS